MIAEIFLFCVAISVVVCLLLFQHGLPEGFPKGPRGVPIFGYLPFINEKNTSSTLAKFRKKYGDIFGMRLGINLVVVLNSHQLAKEALKQDVFSGRPRLDYYLQRSQGKRTGIVFSDGPGWQEQRRFALRHLRDFGFGKSSQEDAIMNEVVEVIAGLRKDMGKPINLKLRFTLAILNSLWRLVAGERFDHNDPKLMHVLGSLKGAVAPTNTVTGISTNLPWLHRLLHKRKASALAAVFNIEGEMMLKAVEHHKSTFNENDMRDFIDVYLREIRNTTNPASSFYKNSGYLNLHTTMMDLFGAGSDTTVKTLRFVLLYMLAYPDVKEKVLQEIDNNIGREKLPSLNDRTRLPYTEAALMDTMRLCTLVPIILQHCTMHDTVFQGYKIPKGTTVLVNAEHINHNPDVWEKPNELYPEHFLTADGKFLNRDEFIPFSTGKRSCPGERLALDTLWLFFVTIMQQLDFYQPPNETFPRLDGGSFQLVKQPPEYSLIFAERA